MNKTQDMPQPMSLEDALQLARLKYASGPVAKPLLCYDNEDHVWCVVDCMIPDEIAWLCWLPEVKPVTLATSPGLSILLPCENFDALESMLLAALLEADGPPYLVDMILAGNRLPYFIGAKGSDNGVQSEPAKVHSDDGGPVQTGEL